MTIGENIKKYRNQNLMAQEEAAWKLNISVEKFNAWETGEETPSIDQLQAAAKLFNTTLNELCNPDIAEEGCLYTAKTVYNDKVIDVIKAMNKPGNVARWIFYIVLIISGFIITWLSNNIGFILSGIYFFITGIVGLIKVIKMKSKSARNLKITLDDEPNKNYLYLFYQDYLLVKINSDVSAIKQKILYKDITRIIEKDKYFFIEYLNTYFVIGENHLGADYYGNLLNYLKYSMYIHKYDKKKADYDLNREIRKSRQVKKLAFIMFILALFALPFGITVLLLYQLSKPAVSDPLANMAIMLVALPLPIASVVTGFIADRHGIKNFKNHVAGISMGGLILFLAWGGFTLRSDYSNNYSYVTKTQQTIGFNLPATGTAMTENWEAELYTDGSVVYYTSHVQFTNSAEIQQFNHSVVNSGRWVTNLTLANEISSYAFSHISQDSYFMIYNKTLNIYNRMPDEPGTYDFIFLAYNPEKASMFIIEYSKTVTMKASPTPGIPLNYTNPRRFANLNL